jgi:hypothetical protein
MYIYDWEQLILTASVYDYDSNKGTDDFMGRYIVTFNLIFIFYFKCLKLKSCFGFENIGIR